MKTRIVGAGVIGVIYGWALAEAGVDVTDFVRRGRRRARADCMVGVMPTLHHATRRCMLDHGLLQAALRAGASIVEM